MTEAAEKKPRKPRVSKKDREEALRLALAHGVKVTVGKFTFEPPNAAAGANDADEIQRKLDAMAKR